MDEQNPHSVHHSRFVVEKHKTLKTMTIRKILGENGPLSELCNGGSCPAAILTDGDSAYIQGYKLEKHEMGQLAAPSGEDFVRIPLSTLKKIAAQVIEA
jgi:hypothetical protein